MFGKRCDNNNSQDEQESQQQDRQQWMHPVRHGEENHGVNGRAGSDGGNVIVGKNALPF